MELGSGFAVGQGAGGAGPVRGRESVCCITGDMGVSKAIVRNATYRVRNQLGVGSRQEIVVWAVRNALLERR